ncbi:MAG: efflux RND transporter periplasmic adaptor subunit, partial [Bryobacteraceae bacterium]
MRRRVLILMAAIGAGFLAGYFLRVPGKARVAQDAQGRRILYWVDPMHPSYKSDRPGIAPDCGMKLEPVYAEPEVAPARPKGRILYWRDPQQPEYRSDRPGLNPETGNELEPVYEEVAPGTVHLNPDKQQLIGVRYDVARVVPLIKRIRALGRVSYDETRLIKVHARVQGWIQQVFVDFTGRAVARGERLLTLYSPELLASQHELLLARKALGLLENARWPEARRRGESLVEAARTRLRLFDLSEEQIETVLATGQPIREVTLYSPAPGYVLRRNAFPAMRVTPETELYTLADLSRVWILAEVFESDAPWIREGQEAHVRMTHLPSQHVRARVSYVQPELDPVTRTLKIRLEADNPGLLLKPEMYADVDLLVPLPHELTVAAEAVLDTGERKTVFVDRGDGYLEPRQVETGERVEGRVVILRGLRPGERIAVSGNFLLDAESQLRGATGAGQPPAP